MQEREEKTISILKEVISQHSGKWQRVLDIGPGSGLMLEQVPDHFEKCAVDIVSKDLGSVRLEKADMNDEEIPFPDDYFDLVICTEVIEHLWNPDNLLYQINKKLHLGGVLILSTPNMTGLSSRIHMARGQIPGVQAQGLSLAQRPGSHIRCYNISSLKYLFELYGFEVLEVTGAATGNRLRRLVEKYPPLSSYVILLARKKKEAEPVCSVDDGKVHFEYGGKI